MKRTIDTIRLAAFPIALVICTGLVETRPVLGIAILAFSALQLRKVDRRRIPSDD